MNQQAERRPDADSTALRLEPWAALLTALGSLVLVVTCGSGVVTVPGSAPGYPSGGDSSAAAVQLQDPSDTTAIPSEPSVDEAVIEPARAPQAMGRFFAALRQLQSGQRNEPVRILWFGDSHTAADFWTGAVRDELTRRFVDGGPGFVRVGLTPYRHERVKVEVQGRWEKAPRRPSRTALTLDGVFGLGGQRAVPRLSGKTTLTPLARFAGGPATWQVLYRLPPGSSFRVSLGGQDRIVREATPAESPEGSPIRRATYQSDLHSSFEIGYQSGLPELFGVIVERDVPGLILDTLGIDGARAATILAWNEAHWVAEVAARAPALLVFAYGTNEVFEARDPETYAEDYRRVLGRARQAAPDADCLMIGPTDVATPDGGSEPRVALIDTVQARVAAELGCAYLSARQLMGGEGSFARWTAEKPALASGDRVHLTVPGYREVGTRTARALLEAFQSP